VKNRAPLLLLAALAACGPTLTSERVKVEPLPADVQTGLATFAVRTPSGSTFVAPNTGGFLRLAADGASWEALSDRPMVRGYPDFKDGLSLALGDANTGIFRAEGDHFVGFEPPVPVLSHEAYSNVGWSALRGRDANGVFWATAAPTFGTLDGRLVVAHLDPAAPTEWVYEEVPLAGPRQTIPASAATLTRDGRLFFRVTEGGVWAVDLAAKQVTEVVGCDHELFRPSHPDYPQCKEDTLLAAGPKGELFILNPNREVWRLLPGETSPTLVVKAGLEELVVQDADGYNNYSPGGPQLYVDPKGRLWLVFTWGNNSEADTSYLYAVDPASDDTWNFIRGDLPRGLRPFGDGDTPLLSSLIVRSGLLLFRVLE
jgi:hypothetical protein